MITILPHTTPQPITSVATDAGLLKMRALKSVISLKKSPKYYPIQGVS